MPLLSRSGRRLSWLSVNIVLNILAASVIAMYQDTLAAVITLAIFLPMVSDMSGCNACNGSISIGFHMGRGDLAWCEECGNGYLIKSRKPQLLELLGDEDGKEERWHQKIVSGQLRRGMVITV